MNASRLAEVIEEAGVPEHEDPIVVFQNLGTGEIFSIQEAVYEARSTDGEGNRTSTGATLFIRGRAW